MHRPVAACLRHSPERVHLPELSPRPIITEISRAGAGHHPDKTFDPAPLACPTRGPDRRAGAALAVERCHPKLVSTATPAALTLADERARAPCAEGGEQIHRSMEAQAAGG